jgi:hypothetical protein
MSIVLARLPPVGAFRLTAVVGWCWLVLGRNGSTGVVEREEFSKDVEREEIVERFLERKETSLLFSKAKRTLRREVGACHRGLGPWRCCREGVKL